MKYITTFILLIVCLNSFQFSDQVDCFRLQDSIYGHFVNCSCNKPFPLKLQTTFTLDQNYEWNPYTSYGIYIIDGMTQNTTYIGNGCLKGVPSEGNKTKGTNLTLSMQCNSLPRELKQYDMIAVYILFPDMKWLTYAIPIPGYSDIQDIRAFEKENGFVNLKKEILNNFMSKKAQASGKLSKIIKFD